ncbi:type II secretion system secretin GspD [Maricaulis sp.]|uniref:type II secretion system secretin GspD n=1 Tax=Maricaulis sp. TaxID=1486257 RepID=UPI003A942D40
MILRCWRGGIAILSVLALQGCSLVMPDARGIHAGQYPAAPVQAAQSAREIAAPGPSATPEPDAAQPDSNTDERDGERLVYFDQQRGTPATNVSGDRSLDNRTLRLNFVDAPVADAVRTIISDALGRPVLVAAGVEGRITLTSPEPTSARVALAALETVLSESGFALIEREAGFLLTREGEAQASLSEYSTSLGYGGRVVPVTHTNPSSILALIDPFLSERVDVIPHDAEGVLVIAGPAGEVESAVDAIQTFDRPFLTNRIFGMYELQYVNAETAKSEVDSVLAGLGGGSGATTTIALPRLNLLFVVTRDRAQFEQIGAWITRFDRPSGGDERRLRYYVVRNTPAATLASQITAAFAGGETGGAASFGPQHTGDDIGAPGTAGDSSRGPEGRLAIIPDLLNNALIIRATDQEYREILELVQRMDVMPPQVLIEATIAEVRLVDGLSFGVRWYFENQTGSGISTTSFTDDVNGTTNPVFPGFNYAFAGTDLRATLNALNSITDVTVLSAPSIMVQNNQTAHLQVGDEVPIVTQTASSVTESNAPLVSSIELRQTGVILEVTPRINASGMVVLDVMQEVSSVRPTTTSGIDSPTIQKLEFTSTVAVRSDNTVALGGLIREAHSDNEAAIPLLGRIPGLGNVFKNRDISSERSELVIFLTPRIITTDEDAANVLLHVRRELEALEARRSDLFE